MHPLLEQAEKVVYGDRRSQYGTPEDNFSRIAKAWTPIIGKELTPRQVCLCMIMLKVVREDFQHKEDNLVDLVGYTLCLAELPILSEKERKEDRALQEHLKERTKRFIASCFPEQHRVKEEMDEMEQEEGAEVETAKAERLEKAKERFNILTNELKRAVSDMVNQSNLHEALEIVLKECRKASDALRIPDTHCQPPQPFIQ